MNKIKDSYLIKYKNTNYRQFRKSKNFLKKNKLKEITEIWPELRLCHIKTEDNQGINVIGNLRKSNDIEYIVQNEIIPPRKGTPDNPTGFRNTTPNDTNYSEQWCHQIMESEEAWKITTGGTTENGIEIVTGVVDGGFYDHQDLQNVFIEPYNGVTDNHGTHVAGIVGANGNNNQGVVGVNWDIKIIPVGSIPSGSNVQTTEGLINQYYHIYQYRKQFNESGGTEGHFVVSINSSWGFDAVPCTGSYIIFNEAYDIMGEEGILNCAATANASWNIDNVGDVPTSCTSDYLISVTNSTSSDNLSSAGYGQTTIDLAAPGSNILSTTDTSGYSYFTGTSMATPQVTGAIALMYAAAGEDVINESIINPAKVALEMKNLLITQGVDTEGLSGNITQTVSQGRLNLKKAVEAVQTLTYSISGSIELTDEWSLVGIPVDIENNSIDLFSNSNATFYYNENSYIEPSILEPLKGYWVRNNINETLILKGQAITLPDIWILNPNTWLLISGLSYESIITNPSAGNYILYEYNKSYNSVNKLEPGKGYWIKSILDYESNLEINRLYPPTANSANYNISVDEDVTITLEADDINNLPLTYEITSEPEHGTLTHKYDNVYMYIPESEPVYKGIDTFSFIVNNGYYNSEEAQVNISIGYKILIIRILTDNYPSETTWTLTNNNNNINESGGPYSNANTLYTTEIENLPLGEYTFTIYDSYGDGICCSYGEGYYTVLIDNSDNTEDDIIVASGGEFLSSETTIFNI